MKDLNKEQILFMLTLVILGVMVYYRLDDRYQSRGMRTASDSYEIQALPPSADIQFVNKELGFFSRDGRNIYAPPRDWLPLDPLLLDPPPQLELLAVAPPTRPGLGESAFSAYYYRPEGAQSPEEEAVPVEGEEEGDAEAEAGTRAGRIDIDLEGEEMEEDPEAALLARYDWLRLQGQASRVFGFILNENKYGLPDNQDAIRFDMVSKTTGKSLGTNEYGRDRVESFGFADTVVNRIELELRKINLHAGNLARIHETARWCLSLAEEDSRAVEYAAGLVEKALELDPLSKESYCLLADIHHRAFDYEAEFKVLRSAIDRRLQAPGVYVRYSRLLNRYGMADAAENALLEAERIEPRNASALAARAGLCYDRGDYAEAHRLYEEAERSPSWKAELKMDVLLGEGKCLLALNQLDEAATKIQRAVNLEEKNGEAWNLKGALHLARGEFDEADQTFRKAVELAPDQAEYVTNLGLALFRKGDLEGAIRKYEESIGMDPFYSCRPTAALGFANECLGEEESASYAYEKAIQIDPRNFYALYLWGRDLRRRGDTESAIDVLKKALQLNNRMKEILGELGHACLLAGLTEDAAFYFEEYLKRGEANLQILYLFGLSLLSENRLDEAVTRFHEAIQLSETTPDPYNGLAYARYSLGEVDECLEAFGKVVRRFDEDSRDPRYEYAKRWMTRIEEHRRKSQWIDAFHRNEIGNNWDVYQRSGVSITLINNQVVFQGTQRQEQPDERTMLRRQVEGREFRIFEADITLEQDNQARAGIFVGYYISRGVQGALAKAEVLLGMSPNGNLAYNLVDRNKEMVSWERIEREKVAAGEAVRLGVEVVDYEEGLLRITVDGESVLAEDLNVKSLKKVSHPLQVGIFTSAPGSRNVKILADDVRVVRRN